DIGELPGWLNLTAPQAIPYIDRTPEWTDRTVHFNRLLRDGWQLIENGPLRTKWQRAHPSQPRILVMNHQFESFSEYGGPYVVEYELRDEQSGETRSLGWATWTDWDQQGRLVLARDGKLLALDQDASFRELADFNPQTPDPAPSPPWAREWPSPPDRRT
ncbi:MAG TPA: hypothetical protein VJB57_19485, partial [Dehalococcoidia bacterium]|nr:hypothetical protein [Dehalococcoidia bacterium]